MLPLPLQEHNGKGRQAFEDLLTSLAALTFRIAEIECQYLDNFASDDSIKPELLSPSYLEWLFTTLRHQDSAMWQHVQSRYYYDPARTRTRIIELAWRRPSQTINTMTQVVQCLLIRARNMRDITEKVARIICVVFMIADPVFQPPHEVTDAQNGAPISRDVMLTRAFKFFQDVDGILQAFIKKQVATLSHEICDIMINRLADLLYRIATGSDALAAKMLREGLEMTQSFPVEAAPTIIERAWKFQVWRKCFLEGRMEIRIYGVESMQNELLGVHSSYIKSKDHSREAFEGSWHPVVPFLCDFILENKLIDYLVGVESHPRLIRASANIVGFLVVCHRYTEAESNKIWKTVRESQDPGVVGALLQMLPGIFPIANYSLLLYLLTLLNEVPLADWDAKFTTYAQALFHHTVYKWREKCAETDTRDLSMDEAPYHCCIRLIRGASGDDSLAPQKRRTMFIFGSQTLENLLDFGPSAEDSLRLFQDCIRDIAKGTAFATGSIGVINILLRHPRKVDFATLAQDLQLADLLITELGQLAALMARSLRDSRGFDEALSARLDLLQHVIKSSPWSINSQRAKSLWETLVGPQAPNDQAREVALMMLINITTYLRERNSFIEACVSEYLPNLQPRFFTRNLLLLVHQASQYALFLQRTYPHAEGLPSGTLGTDLLWRIALVAPADTVERKAIETLVATYLDSPKTLGTTKAAIQRMHVEVVERCVGQLTSAAAQLKAFADGTSSGEDEPMVVVASDEEVHAQRLCFSRSLLILRELSHKIRAHPSYSPVPSANSLSMTGVEIFNGAPVTLRYQPFSGGSNQAMKSLQLGDLEKVRDLTHRFGTATGFSRFAVIVGGQKVNLDEYNDTTLRESGLHQKGLFLIKNIHSNDALPDMTSNRVLKPLELEVMGHFSTLHRFLSLDDELSRDVRPRHM